MLEKELLDRYEKLIIERDSDNSDLNNLMSKNRALTTQLEELSRTVTILRKTMQCLNDFIDNSDLLTDYERFKDKWLEGGNNE